MSIDERANTNTHLTLRRATIEDAEMVFAWRNLPAIIALGTTRRAVEREEHYTWFQLTIEGNSRLLFVVLLNEEPVGQVRFDRLRDHSYEVSIYLLPQYTGRGLGVLALKYACWEVFAQMPVEKII